MQKRVRQYCHNLNLSTNPLIELPIALLQFAAMSKKNENQPYFSFADRCVFVLALMLVGAAFVTLSHSIVLGLL